MRVRWGIALLGLVAFVISGCGGSGSGETGSSTTTGTVTTAAKTGSTGGTGAETTEFRHGSPHSPLLALTLSGWRGPETAGLQMTEERDYFADAAIHGAILSPETPTRPIKYVVEETDDIGISHMPEVVLAKQRGAPIVAIGSLVPHPTAAMIWLRGAGIDGVADLKGKKIAIPGLPFQESFLQVVLARAGLTLKDVKVIEVEYNLVGNLANGRADAIFGGNWNFEGVELRERGLHPVVTRVDSLGFPDYEELVFFARTDRVAGEPQVYRSFFAALQRGTAAAIEDPTGAARAIVADFEGNPETSRREMEAAAQVTVPLLSRSGRMSYRRAERLVDWMHRKGLIREKIPPSEFLTNSYLPR